MSVVLKGVAASAPGGSRLFDGLDMEFGDAARIAVLASERSANAALLRLICGTAIPEAGIVRRTCRVSWPIPLNTFFSNNATVAQNIRFIGRLYDVPDSAFCLKTAELAALGEFLSTPLRKCPRIARARLALALGIAVDFDLYLFDGSLAPVDKPFKEKALEAVASRMAGRGYVLATSNPAEAEKTCEAVYVLDSGRARYFTDLEEGVAFFKKLKASEKKSKAQQGAGNADFDEIGDDEEAVGDIDVVGAAVGGLI